MKPGLTGMLRWRHPHKMQATLHLIVQECSNSDRWARLLNGLTRLDAAPC